MRRICEACRRTPRGDVKPATVGDGIMALGKHDVDDVTEGNERIDNGGQAIYTPLDHRNVTWSDVSQCFDMICFISVVIILISSGCTYLTSAV